MDKTEIKFTTVEKRPLNKSQGKVCHQAFVVHNAVLSEDATRRAFAEYAELKQARADWAIDCLCGFIVEQIEQGNRLDFGGFSVSLTWHGSVQGANVAFDDKRNKIGVALMPGKAMLKAASQLKPVNARANGAVRILSTRQEAPSIDEIDVLDAEGERRVATVFEGGCPSFAGEACGFWVEDDAGVKLCEATDVAEPGPLFRYVLAGSIPKGERWLVAAGRLNGEYLRFTRRITVR